MSQHFIDLIKRGATKEIAAAVEIDPAVASSRDAQGVSALMWAIYTRQTVIRDFLVSGLERIDIFEASAVGDCDRIKALLKADATLARQASGDGWPPLHLAAAFGTTEAVKVLLEHGAHVHEISRNAMRNQALNACVSLGQSLDTARLLIDAGADTCFAQPGGYGPLHQAAANGNVEMVALLLASGSRPDQLCNQGKTPADYARERNHPAIVTLLERTAKD